MAEEYEKIKVELEENTLKIMDFEQEAYDNNKNIKDYEERYRMIEEQNKGIFEENEKLRKEMNEYNIDKAMYMNDINEKDDSISENEEKIKAL